MTDSEILNMIYDQVDIDRLRCETASVRISVRRKNGCKIYRFAGGPEAPTLREAIEVYCAKWQRKAYTSVRRDQ